MSPKKDNEEAVFGPDGLFREKLYRLRSDFHQAGRFSADKTIEEMKEHLYLVGAAESLKNRDQSELEQLALIDVQSGLYNQQAILKILASEIKRSLRYKRPVCVLFAEPDNLIEIERYEGGYVVDEILQELSEVLLGAIRDVDIPARFSQNRFMVVCPETNSKGAAIVATRILDAIAHDGLPNVSTRNPVTVSIGYASCPRHGDTVNKLINRADVALMRAITSGGNTHEGA